MAESEFIDIHKHEKYFSNKLESLEKDSDLSPRNKEIILKYLKESQLGKTIKKGQKRTIDAGRNLQVAGFLCKMAKEWFKKDLDAVTMEDMETFVLALDKGKIKSDRGTVYSSETKKNIKKFLKKFYRHQGKWDLVEWMDTSGEDAHIQAVPKLKEGISDIVELVPDIRRKAMLWVLFDSGFREGELINCTMKDVEKREDGIFYLTCRYSKTRPRTVSLPYSSELLARWLELHPKKTDPKAQLWQTARIMLYKTVKLYGKKAHGINITPHMFRHTSATFYAPKLDRTTFCKRFGWSYNSSSPDRYIDFAKVPENKVVDIVKSEKYHEVKQQMEEMKLKHQSQLEAMRSEQQELKEAVALLMKRGKLT